MLNALRNSIILMIKIHDFQSLGKPKVSSHNFCTCFTSCKIDCHQFLRSASLWEVEGCDVNFFCPFDDNL